MFAIDSHPAILGERMVSSRLVATALLTLYSGSYAYFPRHLFYYTNKSGSTWKAIAGQYYCYNLLFSEILVTAETFV